MPEQNLVPYSISQSLQENIMVNGIKGSWQVQQYKHRDLSIAEIRHYVIMDLCQQSFCAVKLLIS